MNQPLEAVATVPSLPPRETDSHKGTFGRVLVIGGSRGMIGAPALVGLSALRSGAGLVTIALPATVQPVAAAICPCATSLPLPETPAGSIDPAQAWHALENEGLIGDGASAPIDALVIGPGIHPPTASEAETTAYADSLWHLIDAFRVSRGVPVVVDADALNLCRRSDPQSAAGWDSRPHPQTVITPHPGELARMQGVSTKDIQRDRQGFARRTAQTLNAAASGADRAVVVLKGAGTLVTDGVRLYANRTGNPGMATGGSGDVLGGVIGALAAQGMDVFSAAVTGVYYHGRAGDLAAERLGQISMTASDIIESLPAAFREAQNR